MLNITDTRIRLVKRDDGKLRAVASVIIDDCFAIHDIKIISGAEGEFIAMPSKRLPTGNSRTSSTPSTRRREKC